jgi:hypothetical protein
MCTCNCEKVDDGRIKSVCMRKDCNQPMYIRGFENYSRERPLFCIGCWHDVYALTDINIHRDGIREYSIDETKHWIHRKVYNPEWYKARESYKQKAIDSLIS